MGKQGEESYAYFGRLLKRCSFCVASTYNIGFPAPYMSLTPIVTYQSPPRRVTNNLPTKCPAGHIFTPCTMRRKDNNGCCFTWEPAAAGEGDGEQRRALSGGSADGGSSRASPRCWVELDFGKSVTVEGLTIEPLANQTSGENIGYMYGIVEGGAEAETRERDNFFSKPCSHDGRQVRRRISVLFSVVEL